MQSIPAHVPLERKASFVHKLTAEEREYNLLRAYYLRTITMWGGGLKDHLLAVYTYSAPAGYEGDGEALDALVEMEQKILASKSWLNGFIPSLLDDVAKNMDKLLLKPLPVGVLSMGNRFRKLRDALSYIVDLAGVEVDMGRAADDEQFTTSENSTQQCLMRGECRLLLTELEAFWQTVTPPPSS